MNDLSEVTFIDENNGWMVGGYGTILHSGDGGQTWSIQPSGTTSGLFDVSFADAQTGIALGSRYDEHLARDCALILRTTDGGAAWTKVSADTLQRFQAVQLTGPDNGVAVGSAYNEQLAREVGYVFRTTDGGAVWTRTADRLAPGSPGSLLC